MSEIKRIHTLLVAEDDALVRKSTSGFLRNRGYEVLEAENGNIALDLLRERQPDMLLTDLRMPGLDGNDLLQIAIKEFPDMPAIIISGMGTIHDAIDALRNGAFDYITKPVQDMGLILHSVEKAARHVQLVQREKDRHEEMEILVEERTRELLIKNRQLEEEMQRRKVQEELVLHAKKEWERTVDAMPDMIAIIDRDHRIVRTNKTMLDRTGGRYEDVLGTKCYLCTHGASSPPDYCPHTKLLKDGQGHRTEIFSEKLGGYCEIIVVPYRDADGLLAGSIHIIRDMNDRKKADAEKEKLHAQLLHAQKLESVGRLAAGIAHEINTPTQFIGTNVDFLGEAVADIAAFVQEIEAISEKAPPELAGEIVAALEKADWDYLSEELPLAVKQSQDGLQRVSTIVRAMKEFSHPGSKEKEPHDLNNIIETTVTVARNEWKYVAEVEIDKDPNLPQVPLLADEMGQVILNMLVNAAHAIAEKLGDNPEGEKGKIAIATRNRGNMVEMTISDSGAGIPEGARSRIFDPFFTTKKIGKGTGQGLAISHDVITEKHGGTISVTSEENVGTTFTISLPV